MRMTERAARGLPAPADVLELDVTVPEHFEALTAALDERWGGVDGALHAIAFAPADALGGNFLSAPVASAQTAFHVSAVSLRDLAVALRAADGRRRQRRRPGLRRRRRLAGL